MEIVIPTEKEIKEAKKQLDERCNKLCSERCCIIFFACVVSLIGPSLLVWHELCPEICFTFCWQLGVIVTVIVYTLLGSLLVGLILQKCMDGLVCCVILLNKDIFEPPP